MFISGRARAKLCEGKSQLGKQTLEHQNNIKSASVGTADQPGPTRTSLAFRLTCSLVIGLLVLLWAAIQDGRGTGTASTWAMASLASTGVLVFADFLLPLLVVAIPPGMLVLAIIGMTAP
jgi:hypothetical protein